MRILVTGATGNIGRPLTQHLINSRQVELCIAQRSSDKALPGTHSILFDFELPHTYATALAGIDKLFLLRPPQISNVKQYLFPVIDAALAAGVKHIVFLSLQGAEENTITPHHKVEVYLNQVKAPYTFLRPSFFMQNLTTTHAEEIKKGYIMVPAGNGSTNFVDAEDLAEAAAHILTTEGHVGCAYELTGSEAYTYHEVAKRLSQALGYQVRYDEPGALRFLWHHLRRGTPMGFAAVMLAIYTIARLGKAAGYSPDLEKLLSRKPTTLDAFIEREKGAWSQSQ